MNINLHTLCGFLALACPLVLTTTSVSANDDTNNISPNQFESHFIIEVGLQKHNGGSVEYEDFNSSELESTGAVVALGYQFTPEWAIKASVNSGVQCGGRCDYKVSDTLSSALDEYDYEANFMTLEGVYSVGITDKLIFDLSAGMLLSKENFNGSSCEVASSALSFAVCKEGAEGMNYDESDTKYSYRLGASLRYDFFDFMGLKAGYHYSGINNGLGTADISLQFRF